jgi:hypothetical protein
MFVLPEIAMATSIEGGCLCGAIRYRATTAPRVSTLCHCRSCQLASGAPSVAWTVFPVDAFAFVEGIPAQFESSPGVLRTFCGQCGTPLAYMRMDEGGTIDVTTATLDDADDYAPTKEIWIADKLSWERLNDDMRHFSGSSKDAPSLG